MRQRMLSASLLLFAIVASSAPADVDGADIPVVTARRQSTQSPLTMILSSQKGAVSLEQPSLEVTTTAYQTQSDANLVTLDDNITTGMDSLASAATDVPPADATSTQQPMKTEGHKINSHSSVRTPVVGSAVSVDLTTAENLRAHSALDSYGSIPPEVHGPATGTDSLASAATVVPCVNITKDEKLMHTEDRRITSHTSVRAPGTVSAFSADPTTAENLGPPSFQASLDSIPPEEQGPVTGTTEAAAADLSASELLTSTAVTLGHHRRQTFEAPLPSMNTTATRRPLSTAGNASQASTPVGPSIRRGSAEDASLSMSQSIVVGTAVAAAAAVVAWTASMLAVLFSTDFLGSGTAASHLGLSA